MSSKPRIAFIIDALPAIGGGEKTLFAAFENMGGSREKMTSCRLIAAMMILNMSGAMGAILQKRAQGIPTLLATDLRDIPHFYAHLLASCVCKFFLRLHHRLLEMVT